MKIAIIGAESTGKSELVKQFEQHFRAQGKSAQLIPEYLRTWCDQHQRTPRQEEQFAIAAEQARQMNAASNAATAGDILISDTTALTVAAYSELLFGDMSLYDMALTQQREFEVTLLMGLDLTWVADGFQRDGAYMREPVDTALRAALARGGINYQVVYGTGHARLQNALRCLTSTATTRTTGSSASATEDFEKIAKPLRFKNWVCERCSDPECEHRLFTELLNKS